MSKKISVRVSRTKLIASLQKAIANFNDESDKIEAKKLLRNKWEVRSKKIPLASYAKLAHKTEIDIDDNVWRDNDSIKVTVNYFIKKSVAVDKLAYVADVYSFNHDNAIEEIGQAIRLLELSDEDTVNTATYGSVARYL